MCKQLIRRNFGSLIMVMLLLAGILTGCNEQKTQSFQFTATPQVGDSISARREFIGMLKNPETVAAFAAPFPETLQSVGIETDDPLEIERLLEDTSQPSLMPKLAAKLEEMLDSAKTELMFGVGNGDVEMMVIEKLDEDAADTPDNLRLGWEQQRLKNAKVLRITYVDSSKNSEIGYYDLEHGLAPFKPAE